MFTRVTLISLVLLCLVLLFSGCTKKVTEVYESPELIDFVYVKGGTFNNGVADVKLSSFLISRREVTQNEYWALLGGNPAEFQNVVNAPMNNITWFDCIIFCNQLSERDGLQPCYSYADLGTDMENWPEKWEYNYANHLMIRCNWAADGYRLPSEMEWLYAAKGGERSMGYNYSGSYYPYPVAWFSGNAGNTVHTVCTKAANELGLFDMSGNVVEFCWDIYALLPDSSQTNPHGPSSGDTRVLRGGAYSSPSEDINLTRRFYAMATSVNNTLGFRLCRTRID